MGLIKGLMKFINWFRPKLKELITCKDFIRLLMGQIDFIKELISANLSLET